MAGVEVKDVGGFRVEDEADGPLLLLLLLPHLTRYVVSVAEVITKSIALIVKEDASLATES
jgi:hypothetical protein